MGVMGTGDLSVECQSHDSYSSEKINTGLKLNVSKELICFFCTLYIIQMLKYLEEHRNTHSNRNTTYIHLGVLL